MTESALYCRFFESTSTDHCFLDVGTMGPVEAIKVPADNSLHGTLAYSIVCI